MTDAYGFLAPFYQVLSQGVFGSKILEANRVFVLQDSEKMQVFIGGGDGFAYRKFRTQLCGDYWEMSAAMLRKAQKNLEDSGLNFRLGAYYPHEKADRVYLPFVLDTLTDEEILALLEQIKTGLKPDGKVVLSDFFPAISLRQKFFMQVMLVFFRVVTNHARKDLPDYPAFFEKSGFDLVEEKVWEKGWIRAQVYQLRN